MDSSINNAAPYKEKGPPRRKAPVRKPRAKKESSVGPVVISLIPQSERIAIRMAQAKLVAKAKEEGVSTIQRAIRQSMARKAVKNTRANKAMDTAGNILAGNTIARMVKSKIVRDNAITVPIPKEPKPKFKMSYAAALKQWNMSRGERMWCSPKKNSVHWKEIQALRM